MNYNKDLTETVCKKYDLRVLLYKYIYPNHITMSCLMTLLSNIPVVNKIERNNTSIILFLDATFKPTMDELNLLNIDINNAFQTFISTNLLEIENALSQSVSEMKSLSNLDDILELELYKNYTTSIITPPGSTEPVVSINL